MFPNTRRDNDRKLNIFFFFKRRPNVWWSSPIEYSIYYVGWYGRKRVIKPFRHFSSSSSLNLRRASETCVVVVAPETEKYKTHKRFLNKKKFFFFSSFILNILLKFLVQWNDFFFFSFSTHIRQGKSRELFFFFRFVSTASTQMAHSKNNRKYIKYKIRK